MPLRKNTYRRQAYKTGSSFSVGPLAARYLILMLLAVFSLMFLIESAQGSNGIMQLRNLQNQQSDLSKQATTLQVNASREQSLQTLSQSASAQGLVPLDSSLNTITVPAASK